MAAPGAFRRGLVVKFGFQFDQHVFLFLPCRTVLLEGEGGIAGLAEARVDLGQFVDFMSQIQIYGFYDVGTVFRNNVGTASDWESLSSAGGGVRLGAYGVFADMQIAKPLTRTPTGQPDKDPRYMFSVSLGL